MAAARVRKDGKCNKSFRAGTGCFVNENICAKRAFAAQEIDMASGKTMLPGKINEGSFFRRIVAVKPLSREGEEPATPSGA